MPNYYTTPNYYAMSTKEQLADEPVTEEELDKYRAVKRGWVSNYNNRPLFGIFDRGDYQLRLLVWNGVQVRIISKMWLESGKDVPDWAHGEWGVYPDIREHAKLGDISIQN
jgi:hypothetical protein